MSGAIKEPGFYSLEETKTLKELIQKLDFVNVYPWLGVLEQFDETNLERRVTLFNLNDSETYENIKLLPNSYVYFANIQDKFYEVSPRSLELIEAYQLKINHKGIQYVLPVYGNYRVESFVKLLGLDMTDVDSIATYISPLDEQVIQANYEEMSFIAKKYNMVSFRSPVNNLITVSIDSSIDCC